jgi:thiol-disulfide isomerase/thioredoxin
MVMKTTFKFMVSKPLIIYTLLLTLMVVGLATVAIVLVTNGRVPFIHINQSVGGGSGQGLILATISTDNAPTSLNAISDGGTNASKRITGTVQIPDPNSQITVVMVGAVGCADCAFESQALSHLLNEYGKQKVRAVFVDVYKFGGPDALAWFANVLDAANLTWAIDTDGSFKGRYNADINTTLIMDRGGQILYRNDVLTSAETLRQQIEAALSLKSVQ